MNDRARTFLEPWVRGAREGVLAYLNSQGGAWPQDGDEMEREDVLWSAAGISAPFWHSDLAKLLRLDPSLGSDPDPDDEDIMMTVQRAVLNQIFVELLDMLPNEEGDDGA